MKVLIYPILAFKDNYIWAITYEQKVIIVDPGHDQVVLDFLSKHRLTLAGILVTHHHWDHTDGILHLKERFDIPIWGPQQILGVTHFTSDNQQVGFTYLPFSFQVFHIPGHTLDHVAYYGAQYLFCGDTLFSAGCGRLFEGSAAQLYTSLLNIKHLPNNTQIYCAHEYTLNNLYFAHQVEPDNADVLQRLEEVTQLRRRGQPSLPSTLELEKKINPFLRCDVPQIIRRVEEYANQSFEDTLSVFTWLRKWKDSFS